MMHGQKNIKILQRFVMVAVTNKHT